MIAGEARAKITYADKIREDYRFFTEIPKSEGGEGDGVILRNETVGEWSKIKAVGRSAIMS